MSRKSMEKMGHRKSYLASIVESFMFRKVVFSAIFEDVMIPKTTSTSPLVHKLLIVMIATTPGFVQYMFLVASFPVVGILSFMILKIIKTMYFCTRMMIPLVLLLWTVRSPKNSNCHFSQLTLIPQK